MRKPEQRCSYAVKHGHYAGEILIFVKSQAEIYQFLSIPKMVNRDIPIQKFDFATENGIVDYIEKIPNTVYKAVYLQFEKNRLQHK